MDESTANEVVELLRARRIFASVNRRAGVYNVGVRVVIPDGREAIWDNDGAAGLEAMLICDGVLVGFVPQIPDSDDLDAAAVADVIAKADYDTPPSPEPPSRRSPSPASPPEPPAAAPSETPPPSKPSGWRDRLRRRH